MRRFVSPLFLFAAVLIFVSCKKDPEITGLPEIYYQTDIKPIINSQCTMCHSEYSTYNGLMSIVTKGKPEKSELYNVITNPWALIRMPRDKEPLTKDQRTLIHLWILQGAPNDSIQ